MSENRGIGAATEAATFSPEAKRRALTRHKPLPTRYADVGMNFVELGNIAEVNWGDELVTELLESDPDFQDAAIKLAELVPPNSALSISPTGQESYLAASTPKRHRGS